jgi:23S rRNA (cytosine1962-C5)-methyltransferase
MARKGREARGVAADRVEKPTSSRTPQDALVVINERGAARLKAGHVWVYRSDVVSADGVAPGALVRVIGPRGIPLGSALYSSASQIALRLISTRAVEDLPGLLRERIQQALAYRELVVQDTNACRLIFSEADLLPGLIVDRYNDILCLQSLTQAMEAEAVRQPVISELSSRLSPEAIVERVELRIRELEQLPARGTALLQGNKARTVFTMNGIRFNYSALEGQKTGAFLDQRENYAAAAKYAHGEAMDVFCYQGGFALHMAPRCASVTGADSSRPALEAADQNAVLNACEVEWIEANAFDLLKDYASAGRQYDTIVLDPPAFAKSRKNLDTALRGYKELNLRALKMLRPGGILVTCSCSYHVSQADFIAMLTEAAVDTHKTVRILEVRSQARDHPVVLGIPETSYLKAVIALVNY